MLRSTGSHSAQHASRMAQAQAEGSQEGPSNPSSANRRTQTADERKAAVQRAALREIQPASARADDDGAQAPAHNPIGSSLSPIGSHEGEAVPADGHSDRPESHIVDLYGADGSISEAHAHSGGSENEGHARIVGQDRQGRPIESETTSSSLEARLVGLKAELAYGPLSSSATLRFGSENKFVDATDQSTSHIGELKFEALKLDPAKLSEALKNYPTLAATISMGATVPADNATSLSEIGKNLSLFFKAGGESTGDFVPGRSNATDLAYAAPYGTAASGLATGIESGRTSGNAATGLHDGAQATQETFSANLAGLGGAEVLAAAARVMGMDGVLSAHGTVVSALPGTGFVYTPNPHDQEGNPSNDSSKLSRLSGLDAANYHAVDIPIGQFGPLALSLIALQINGANLVQNKQTALNSEAQRPPNSPSDDTQTQMINGHPSVAVSIPSDLQSDPSANLSSDSPVTTVTADSGEPHFTANIPLGASSDLGHAGPLSPQANSYATAADSYSTADTSFTSSSGLSSGSLTSNIFEAPTMSNDGASSSPQANSYTTVGNSYSTAQTPNTPVYSDTSSDLFSDTASDPWSLQQNVDVEQQHARLADMPGEGSLTSDTGTFAMPPPPPGYPGLSTGDNDRAEAHPPPTLATRGLPDTGVDQTNARLDKFLANASKPDSAKMAKISAMLNGALEDSANAEVAKQLLNSASEWLKTKNGGVPGSNDGADATFSEEQSSGLLSLLKDNREQLVSLANNNDAQDPVGKFATEVLRTFNQQNHDPAVIQDLFKMLEDINSEMVGDKNQALKTQNFPQLGYGNGTLVFSNNPADAVLLAPNQSRSAPSDDTASRAPRATESAVDQPGAGAPSSFRSADTPPPGYPGAGPDRAVGAYSSNNDPSQGSVIDADTSRSSSTTSSDARSSGSSSSSSSSSSSGRSAVGGKSLGEMETRIGAGDGNLTGKYGEEDPQLSASGEASFGNFSAAGEAAAGADADVVNEVDEDGHRQMQASANAGVGASATVGYEDEHGNFVRSETQANASAGAQASSTRNAETGIRDTSAGVGANASASETVSWGSENGSNSVSATADADVKAEGGVRTNDDGVPLGVHGGASVGVGAELGGSDTRETDKGSSEANASVGVGVGAGAEGEFGMNEDGKFVIGGELELTAGIGGSLGARMEFDIDEYEKQAEDIDNRWHNGDKWGAVTETGDMLLDSAEQIPLAGGFVGAGRDIVGGYADAFDELKNGNVLGALSEIGDGYLDGMEDLPILGGLVEKLRDDGFVGTAMEASQAINKGLDKVEDAANKAAKGIKKGAEVVGEGIKDGAEAVGEGIKDGAEAVGEGIKDGAEAVGEGIKDGAEAVGDGIKDGFKAIGGLFG